MKELTHWGKLPTVLALATHGSYRAAGAALGMTSTTVARHIEALSEEIGDPLFVPSGDKWEPTQAGKELIKITNTPLIGTVETMIFWDTAAFKSGDHGLTGGVAKLCWFDPQRAITVIFILARTVAG